METLGRAGYSWELLGRRAVRTLERQGGWLLFGFLGAALIASYLMFQPLQLDRGVVEARKAAMFLAAWLLAFSELYLLAAWLGPRAQAEERDLAHTPLPAGQFFLHRLLDLGAVPLANLLLCLPLYWIVLVYVGLPYGEGAGVRDWWRYMYWEEQTAGDHNPWGVRVALVFVNLCCAVLLPLACAMLLDLALRWAPLRAIALPAVTLGSYFLIRQPQVRYDLFRFAYKQSRGFEAWPFILIFALMVLLPFVVARLSARGRVWLCAAFAAVVLLATVLVFAQGKLPGKHTTARLREALGDGRYALAYFYGHLSPAENIDLLFNNYPTNVLLSDQYAHNLIPRRVALWIGAGLYPPLLCVLALGGMWLGAATRPRRAGDET